MQTPEYMAVLVALARVDDLITNRLNYTMKQAETKHVMISKAAGLMEALNTVKTVAAEYGIPAIALSQPREALQAPERPEPKTGEGLG
jgi:hypothetical protein